MWSLLKRTDIEEARQELTLRRATILKRQREELERLNADQAEIRALEELVDLFAARFKPAKAGKSENPVARKSADPMLAEPAAETVPAPQIIVTKEPVDRPVENEPAATPTNPETAAAQKADSPAAKPQPVSEKPRSRFTHGERRSYSGTNFELFSRAVSKSAF